MLLFFSLASFHIDQFFFSLLMLKVKVHAVVKAADIAVACKDRFNVILMLPLCEWKTKITHKKEKKIYSNIRSTKGRYCTIPPFNCACTIYFKFIFVYNRTPPSPPNYSTPHFTCSFGIWMRLFKRRLATPHSCDSYNLPDLFIQKVISK